MRKFPWAGFGLITAGALVLSVFGGCGSEDATVDDTGDGGNETTAPNNEAGSGVDSSQSKDTGAKDAFIDAILDSSRGDAANCKLAAQTCANSTECCSNNCNKTTMQCDTPLSVCVASGNACATGPECCTFSCIGGTCSAKQCVADNLACATDAECCAGKCAPDGLGGGKCAPLVVGGPKSDGNPCVNNADCASKLCNNGVCTPSSFCQQNGDICVANTDCCGGSCAKAAGSSTGVCGLVSAGGAGGCDQSGTVCTFTGDGGACGGNCCTRSCAPFGPTGSSICQPASGCHVLGDLCRTVDDCCGAPGSPQPLIGPYECVKGSPTQEFGLCGKGNSCHEPGSLCGKALEADGVTVAVCSAANNCCEIAGPGPNCNNTPEKCCRRDAVGIPRCIINKNLDCTAAPPAPGTVCATSADCCGKPCVNNVCSGTCINNTGVCTANADCCAGLPCAIPSGASKGVCGGTLLPDGGVMTNPDGGVVVTQDGGTAADGGGVCALYGQACTSGSTTECCARVPCTGPVGSATCRFP